MNNHSWARIINATRLLTATIGALLTLPAWSQQSENGTEYSDPLLEEVIVTGTRITRRDFSSPSPLVTISREDLEFSGQPTLEDYLNQMPQFQPISGRALNNGGDGTTALDLRGLGPGRTLVMLNGRRVASSGVGSAIDVNNLPSTLVDRVEIITGGASTVYGSDAIAGVVNFITRKDFEGLSFEGGYNLTGEGDANIWDANFIYGHPFDNGGSITAYAGRYERESLFASQRDTTSIPYFEVGDGTLAAGGNPNIPGSFVYGPPGDFGNGPENFTWDPDGTPRPIDFPAELYNFQSLNYLQTPLERDTLGLFGQWPVSDHFEAYWELSYARNQAGISLAESPFTGVVFVNLDNPVLTPETLALLSQPQFGAGPGVAGMFLGRRLSELGPRMREFDRIYQRYLAGIRGLVWNDWRLDAWFTYTDADEEEHLLNDASRSRIQQGLLVDPATGQCFDPSGGCTPLDIFGAGRISPNAANFIRVGDLLNITRRKQSLVSIVLTGEPFEIWSGPVDMAFGAEWRQDKVRFKADDVLFTGDTVGYRGTAPVGGTESVYELFTEAVLTLYEASDSVRRLDLETGYRWSHYDNAGSVSTWKAGLNWQVTDSIAFRTMYQHAVRAPNSSELFTLQSTETLTLEPQFDPCSASRDPIGNGNLDKCVQQGIPADQVGIFEPPPFYAVDFIGGGNPNLEPEASDTFTLGMVMSPAALPGLTLAIDYWDLEVTDAIGGLSTRQVCFDPQNTTGLFCENIQRDPTMFNISSISGTLQNRGIDATDGIDLQLQYVLDLPETLSLFGEPARFAANATLSHVLSRETQAYVFTETIDSCNGVFGQPCSTNGALPENRALASLNYQSGPLSANLSWRWIDGMTNASLLDEPDQNLAVPSISSWNYFDLGMGYNWKDRLQIRLGVNNLFDKEPPMMANAVFVNNTDTVLYDVFGRTYYLNFRFQATGP